ncbi:beta strand repeat-containing protein [Bythopirellula goksoeyrii]|nr:hypothetical protein [Bythopirellula goksoeyrii]
MTFPHRFCEGAIARRSIVALLQTTLLLVTMEIASAQGRQEIVVKQGDAAAGGGQISQVIGPILVDDFGALTYQVELNGAGIDATNNRAILQLSSGTTSELVRSGATFGSGTDTLGPFELRGLNTNGEAHFTSQVVDGSSVVPSLLRFDSGQVAEIAREGVGEVFPELGDISDQSNLAGEVVFTANSGIVEQSLLVGDGATLRVVATQGQSLPTGGEIFTFIGTDQFTTFSHANESGNVAFGVVADISQGSRRQYFLAVPNGTSFDLIRLADLPNLAFGSATPAINNLDQVAMQAYDPITFEQNILVHTSAGIEVISEFGDTSATGFHHGFEREVLINDTQNVAFIAQLDGNSDPNQAIILSAYANEPNAGVLRPVAATGDLTPAGDYVLDELALSTFTDSNIVGFESTLFPTAGGGAGRGYFLGDGIDLVQVVTSSPSAASAEVADFSVAANAFNSGSGQVAYLAVMGDGSTQARLFTPDLRYRSETDGDFTQGNNWTLAFAPTVLHRASISTDADTAVVLANSRTVKFLEVGGGSGESTLQIASGTTLTAVEGFEVHENGRVTGGNLAGDVLIETGGEIAGVSQIAGVLVNLGVVEVDAASGMMVLGNISNQGEIHLPVGGELHSNGILRVGGGVGPIADLKLDGNATVDAAGGLQVLSNGRVHGTGTVIGDVIANSGSFLSPVGTLSIQGRLVHRGLMSASGNGVSLDVTGDVENHGTLTAVSGGKIIVGGELNLRTGALLEISHFGSDPTFVAANAGGGINLDTGSQLDSTVDQATIVGPVSNVGTISGPLRFADEVTNTGLINVGTGDSIVFQSNLSQSGTFKIDPGAMVFVSGTYSGAGGITGGGTLQLDGEVHPGDSPASVSLGGNLVLGENSSSFFEIGGSATGQFDQFVLAGDATLSGGLSVSLISGLTLSNDQTYPIFEVGGALSGQFNGLGEGALVGTFNDTNLFITYAGGDGNDVTLFSTISPEGPVWIGGTGNWHDGENWSTGFVPNQTDIALVDSGDATASVVSVDRNSSSNPATINVGQVRLDPDDELRITPEVRLTVHGGVVENNGRIVLESGGGSNSNTALQAPFGDPLSIEGAGEIQMHGVISTGGGDADLQIGAGQHITGRGVIRVIGGTLTNLGVIEANVSGTQMTVGAGAAQFVNGGTLRASSDGEMNLFSPVAIEGGTIEAVGAGSLIRMFSTRLQGVTLVTDQDGRITTNGNPVFFEDVTNAGITTVQTVTVTGTFVNEGRMSFTNSANPDLILGNDLTLSGGGTLAYFPNGADVSPMVTGAFAFANVDNRIEGHGEMIVSSIAMGDSAVLAPSQASTTVGGFFFDAPTTLDGTAIEFDLVGTNVNSFAPNASRVNVESRTGSYTTQYDQVHVFDTLTLDGVVEISVMLQEGFVPGEGNFFDILSADQIILDGSLDFAFPIVDGMTFSHEILNLLDPATIDAENPTGVNRDVLRITFDTELPFPPGDFNSDGIVDGGDFLLWQRELGTSFDANDLTDWQTNYGSQNKTVPTSTAVPEPSTAWLASLGGVLLLHRLRRGCLAEKLGYGVSTVTLTHIDLRRNSVSQRVHHPLARGICPSAQRSPPQTADTESQNRSQIGGARWIPTWELSWPIMTRGLLVGLTPKLG